MLTGTDFRPKQITSAKWMIWTVITQIKRCTKMTEISQNERFGRYATEMASGGFFKGGLLVSKDLAEKKNQTKI